MDEAARMAHNVDSAIFRAGMLPFQAQKSSHFGSRSYGPPPTSMEIGKVERQRNLFQRGFSRRKYLLNHACFVFHKEGFRAWKHNERNLRMIVDEGIGEIRRM